jgi:hypothetical protein
MAAEVSNIEEFMWKYSCRTASFSASSMRDRFQYLFSLNGVLRMESLYLADLSDLCDFIFHQKEERDPYMCLILRIGTGKTSSRRTIFGRAMRHIDPRLCCMGGLGFYLLLRFLVTREHEAFDFTDNKTWFNRKLIRAMPQEKKRKKTMTEAEAIANLLEVAGALITRLYILKLVFTNIVLVFTNVLPCIYILLYLYLQYLLCVITYFYLCIYKLLF